MRVNYLNAWAVELLIESITITMPRYDYECPGEEIIQEFVLPAIHEQPRCVTCGSVMRRVFTPTAVIFRGKGWGKD